MEADSIGNETKYKPTKKPRSSATKNKPSETVIYLGPNIARGRLRQHAVFRGGIPDRLRALVGSDSHIQKLLVPVIDLAKVQQRIQTPGTLEHTAFQALKGGNN